MCILSEKRRVQIFILKGRTSHVGIIPSARRLVQFRIAAYGAVVGSYMQRSRSWRVYRVIEVQVPWVDFSDTIARWCVRNSISLVARGRNWEKRGQVAVVVDWRCTL